MALSLPKRDSNHIPFYRLPNDCFASEANWLNTHAEKYFMIDKLAA